MTSSFWFLIQYWIRSFKFIDQILNGRPCGNINTRKLLKFSATYRSRIAFYVTVVEANALFYVLLYHLEHYLHSALGMGVKWCNSYFVTTAVLELFQKITVPGKTLLRNNI
jgi:hypothetical protein